MPAIEVGSRVALRNILYLTDFSEPCEAALPFALAVARRYRACVHALHVLIPAPYAYMTPELTGATIGATEESAQMEMQRLESQLAGLQHQATVERGTAVWPAVERAIEELRIDLVVLGTHGRTGLEKLLLGSVAEEVIRRAPVPVLTIGPGVRSSTHTAGRFHRVLFATDLSPESLAAAPLAVSLAEENQSRLLLTLVMRKPPEDEDSVAPLLKISAAEAMHRLYEVVPDESKLDFPPEVAVQYGEPAERIVELARERCADLIVLGVRDAAGRLGAATHLERGTAHKVVAHAPCPVLTLRG